MRFDATVKPSKEALQALIDGLDEVCKKVVDNPVKLYNLNSVASCIIGLNYGTSFYSTLSEIFKVDGLPFEPTLDSIKESGMAIEFKEVNKLFVSHKPKFGTSDHIIHADDWLFKAGTVRTYLEAKLKELEVESNG